MSRVAWSALCLSCLTAVPVSAQGTIQRLRDETAPRPSDSHPSDSSAPSSSSSSSSSHKSSSDDSDCDDFLRDLGGGLFLTACEIATVPLWGPSVLLGDYLGNPGHFPPHPYSGDMPGYVQVLREHGNVKRDEEISPDDPNYLKWWSVRLSVEDGNDFRGLNRLNGQLVFDTTLRVGLWTNWDWLHERLPCGCTDETLLSATSLTFRIAQSEYVLMHAGAGFRMMNDRTGDRFGFNFLYGADVFPAEPFVLSALLEGGTLGEAGVFHTRGSAGVIYHGWEVYLGYDFLRVGTVNVQGPMAGLRFWF